MSYNSHFMKLAFYFFRQFIPPWIFGSFIFVFVLLLDRLFDMVDLIFNKGIGAATVGKLFILFIPTILPLALPMGILLACLVTFGRISEENELTAVRAAGISLIRVLWMPLLFALTLSFLLVPFNTQFVPWSNRAFAKIYEELVHAEPLINIIPRKFFSVKNIKVFANSIDSQKRELKDVFVYQTNEDGRPPERIFAETGIVETDAETFQLRLKNGQLQRFDPENPSNLIHTTFGNYDISTSLNLDKEYKNTRFRNIPTSELKTLIKELKEKGMATNALEAEYALRFAIAFASASLVLIGIPLATTLKKGGRSFSFGVTIMVIFTYYLLLIFGLTLAEKGKCPPHLALWGANAICFLIGGTLFYRLQKI